jgi:hypothetical protein
MPWVHLQDEERMILWAAENASVRGPLNLVAPGSVTNAHFTQALAKQLRRPALFPVPAFVMKAALGGLADVVLASQRAIPQAALAAGFRFDFPDLHTALADLSAGKATLTHSA